MRFHVIGLPHTQTTRAYETCAFTANVRKFCDMMAPRHEVFLYAGEDNEANCTELIPCISTQRQRESGFKGPEDALSVDYNPNGSYWRAMNDRAAHEIGKRERPGDFLCLISGSQWPISQALPHMTAVEYAVGYQGIEAPYRVFPSYAWMHSVYGWKWGAANCDPSDFDAVIPHFFNPDEFPLGKHDGGFFLYVGRLIDRKGWRIAQDVCESLGQRLVVAGRGDFDGYGEYVGPVSTKERADLMGAATATFMPTRYIEPFGCVAAEALLCGTPVITSDHGAATEIIANGVNGQRCRSRRDYLHAVEWALVGGAHHAAIRGEAQAKYGHRRVGAQYDAYFAKLADGRGWYA